MEEDAECPVSKALEACMTAQAMIDINADHLDGLRTQCATSAELTQHEIRALESKLIKLFSKQLVAKRKCGNCEQSKLMDYPKIKQWLKVVGLSNNPIQGICDKLTTMEALLEASEKIVKEILYKHNAREEDIRRLLIALRNLRSYTEKQMQETGCSTDVNNGSDLDLHWDSWDTSTASPRITSKSRTARSSVPSEDILKSSPAISTSITASASSNLVTTMALDMSPPPTPPYTSSNQSSSRNTSCSSVANSTLVPDSCHLTKSKSHEEHLANKIEPSPDATLDTMFTPTRVNEPRRRLATEPGLESSGLSPLVSSPSPDHLADSCFSDDNSSASTNTQLHRPAGMGHVIHHRFTSTLKVTMCHYCDKPMFFGLKCKECKYRCHKDCVERVPPSCGLPNELVYIFAEKIRGEGSSSPILGRVCSPSLSGGRCGSGNVDRKKSHHQGPYITLPASADSSSTSSCNSSTPSSPALFLTPAPPRSKFIFADSTLHQIDLLRKDEGGGEMVETQKSNDSDKTVSGTSGSTDSEKTLAGRVDSQDSQLSDADASERSWPRQNSLSLREWDIPYDEVKIKEKLGSGRFGTVYKGNWHGSVAIKMLNMDHITDDKATLETFKQEVATFRKTRHENLVLFMGACMKPPHLAIITSLCKGMTLYTIIHLRKSKFNLNRSITISQQISQGMGYLHARDIIHKDLKTKNIFYENGKVIITDFGLFSVTKLCQGNRKGDWLTIPKGWLCYLAPEVIRKLQAGNHQDDLPFSRASDMYAFGTVWFELICGEWPFADQPPEAIIWQVGKGIKQSLANLQAARDVKDILLTCWAYKPSDRPEFSKLLTLLSRVPLLPKKRLARSPSHPLHLSRSAESVF